MAASPESLQMLTANSVRNAIPVIFNKIVKNWLLIFAFVDKLLNKLTIPLILSKDKNSIIVPANREIYITNSGLYCFKIIIAISATRPVPMIFTISRNLFHPIYNSKTFITV